MNTVSPILQGICCGSSLTAGKRGAAGRGRYRNSNTRGNNDIREWLSHAAMIHVLFSCLLTARSAMSTSRRRHGGPGGVAIPRDGEQGIRARRMKPPFGERSKRHS